MAEREMYGQTEQDADQTAADLDQTHADTDQAASEADQVESDADQALADRDQHASDRDQAAADWEHAQAHGHTLGGEAHDAHHASRVERDASSRERESTSAGRSRTTGQRLRTAARRDDVARLRDLTAASRDRIAQARDEAADARDTAAEARERHAVESGNMGDVIAPLRALRLSAAAFRQQAAGERAAAAADREAAAADRELAAADRRYAGMDELTGVFRRGTGELALTREIDRARRSGLSLTVAMIDVDELKAVNDSQGHQAGDAVLRDVATSIISTMRSYDVTVRWGGDEFVAALSDVALDVASERIAEIKRALETLRPGVAISAGITELKGDDTLESLIARADAALYDEKGRRETGRGRPRPGEHPSTR
jgi:diguanylate cyclase (GGDEF)-like protein